MPRWIDLILRHQARTRGGFDAYPKDWRRWMSDGREERQEQEWRREQERRKDREDQTERYPADQWQPERKES